MAYARDPAGIRYDSRVNRNTRVAVRRGTFTAADPFDAAPSAEIFALVRSSDGGKPLLPTTCSVRYDDRALYAHFIAIDDHRVATYRNHDDPLWEEDVVEVFLSPETLTRYFEFEVSPAGATFDAAVFSPDGARATMTVDRNWDCAGLQVFQQLVHDTADSWEWHTLLVIPFESLGRTTPVAGETWRANFFRVDRHTRGDEYSAWQATLKTPPDFHVPSAFGTIVFE